MILSFQQTVIGRIGIATSRDAITNLYFATDDNIPQNAEIRETELIREAFQQLHTYFLGKLRTFSLPLAPSGTPFMHRVWEQLCNIPYGSTASYKEIATATGNPCAARAVGMANHRNPIPIFIPCHRVVGSNGNLTGYRSGLCLKKVLLELEQKKGG
ncbi:MAG: methylated-DNA--[protein]-cysteine S-methyltransferase [Chlorobiaceae bacterium]